MRLSLDERQFPQIFAVEPEQIKGDETRLLASEQIKEDWPSGLIDAGHLAVDNGFIDAQPLCQRSRERIGCCDCCLLPGRVARRQGGPVRARGTLSLVPSLGALLFVRSERYRAARALSPEHSFDPAERIFRRALVDLAAVD